jgi:hypothetical protein
MGLGNSFNFESIKNALLKNELDSEKALDHLINER